MSSLTSLNFGNVIVELSLFKIIGISSPFIFTLLIAFPGSGVILISFVESDHISTFSYGVSPNPLIVPPEPITVVVILYFTLSLSITNSCDGSFPGTVWIKSTLCVNSPQ